jgi:recombinational DNA repair protein (RecF pathway)
MLTVIWLWIKSYASPLMAFIGKYWQFFLMAAVIFAAFHYYQKSDQIQFEYDQHIISYE